MTETAFFAGQTVEAARRALAARFRERGIDSAELDARLLAGAALGLDLTGLMTATTRIITQHESVRLENFTQRRLASEPTARILGAHCTGIESVYRLRELLGLTRQTCLVGTIGAVYDLNSGIKTGRIAQ